ncbi:MAG: protein kinase [Symploca sp. SIO2C1]|nr:protein kinase [Symploca sp. SIO2C1]
MLPNILRGRYKIISSLASGGFGETFLAQDQDLPGHPQCVVKQLKPQSNHPFILQTSRRLFDQEAKILHQLGNHDQIPTLLAHFEENQEFYLVQELIIGHDLKQEFPLDKRWSEEQVVVLLKNILQILEYVHQHNVIHRDLKPANLIRRASDGKLVLIDFGAVKQVTTQITNTQPQQSLTIVIGTPGYIPAEQLQGKPRLSSDIYALGILGIQALTGVLPNQLPEDPQTGEVSWRNQLEVGQVRGSPLLDILDKMVLRDFRQRYQSATEVLQVLASLAANLPTAQLISPSLRAQSKDQTLPLQVSSQPTLATSNHQLPPIELNRQEYRLRQILINKVRNFWIKGVLETSLHGRAMIALGLEERTDLVQRPWGLLWGNLDTQQQALPSNIRVSDKFSEMGEGRSLLILGEPGAGKTTTLLELTRDLLDIAKTDWTQPIPVVFNLSSWKGGKQTIRDWLVQELNTQYQVSQEIAKSWVKAGQLLLLLDGLDEVSTQLREACVLAINQFSQEHGTTEIVVCCRIQDYQAIKHRLTLQAAICLQPLSPQQIHQYLNSVGVELAAVSIALQEDTILQELASSPLMLSIITLAYQGMSREDLPKISAIEERRKHLFDAYIQRMLLSHRNSKQSYPKDTVIHWLSWLAQRLDEQSQTVFLIERIQPDWFQTNWQKKIYVISLLLSFILFVWLVGNLVFSRTTIQFVLLLFASGLLFWFLFGLQKINPVEQLKWSWAKAIKNLVLGLTVGTILALLLKIIYELIFKPWFFGISLSGDLLFYSFIRGIVFGMTMGLIFGITRGFTGEYVHKVTIPNQGILQSAKNAIIFSLIGFIILFTAANLLQWYTFFWGIIGLAFGLALGGGEACFKHFILRIILYCSGSIPWNYAHFLNYATERIFLQKVGGGYIFIHRLLLEHFAKMSK